MDKKTLVAVNISLAELILVADILFMTGLLPKYFIKTLASALFVLLGLYNLVVMLTRKESGSKKAIILFAGLVMAFLGDVLLIDHFILGAIFFAIGHLFFLAYFITLIRPNLKDLFLLVPLVIFALLLILLYDGFEFEGMMPIVLVYALIISLMLAKAGGNLISQRTLKNFILFIGAFLFYFSDLMLLFNNFSSISPAFDYLCLISYYPAEILLAMAIICPSKK